jgi:hypothetical protein
MARIEVRDSGDSPRRRRSGRPDPLVARWQKRIGAAERQLRRAGGDLRQEGGWKSLIRLYGGDQWEHVPNPRRFHRITSNLIKANIDVLRPQLYFVNPRVKIQVRNPYVLPEDVPEMAVNPATGQPEPVMRPAPPVPAPAQPAAAAGQFAAPQAAPPPALVPVIKFPKGSAVAKVGGQWVDASEQVRLLEEIDNYYLDEMDFKSKMRRIITDSLVLPYGVGKIEWVTRLRRREEPVFSEPEGVETGTRTVEEIQYEGPQFRRIKPWNFLWDPELDEFDLSQARWVAEIFYASREQLEADPNLVNLDRIGNARWNAGIGEDEPEMAADGDGDTARQEFARYKCYEIHDLEHGKLIVWVEGSDVFQRFEDSPYESVEGSVYTVLGYDEDVESAFPLSLVEQMKTKQQAYNYILSYMTNHIRRFNRKYAVTQGTLNPDEEAKLEEGADGSIIRTEGQDPRPIQDAPISVDMYNVKEVLKRELTEETGVSSMQRASREPGVNTAYEASQIQGGADLKVQEKRDIVRRFVTLVVRKLNQILKLYATREQVLRIAGPKGVHWVRWTREDIQGEFFEDVDIYTSQPFSQEMERRQAMELFSLVARDPYFDPYEVRRELQRKMGWSDKVLLTPDGVRQKMETMTSAELEMLDLARRDANTGIRGTGGQTRRDTDMMAGVMGPVRRFGEGG